MSRRTNLDDEQRHVERLAERLLVEHPTRRHAVQMAEHLAGLAKGRGRDVWLRVAAHLKTRQPAELDKQV